jgi:SAM-dependent methyltransferase
VDRERAGEFARHLMEQLGAAMLCRMIDLGRRTGLLEVVAQGPGDSAELARRAGLDERYVREWLGGMVAGGVVTYDPDTGLYALPPEHAVCLTGDSFYNLAPMASLVAGAGELTGELVGAFRHGGGFGLEAHPQTAELIDEMGRARYDTFLISRYLEVAPDVVGQLDAGARVLDVGCGTGHVANLIAAAFPRSEVTGIDTSQASLQRGREEARRMGLANVDFREADAAHAPHSSYALITAFDVIHDLPHPADVLAAIRARVAPGGAFLMYDAGSPSALAEHADLPWAPLMYGLSLHGCLPSGLRDGGAGLGTMWGRERAVAMLEEAGFPHIEVHDAPGAPMNAIYVARAA